MRIPTIISAVMVVLATAHVVSATEPRSSGLHELEVFHPGEHERGLPAIRFESFESADGKQATVDIPPTVHIHRFYYSGDKEFQGPIIQGGPTVVVANHPKTGERLYVHVTLPPGAPTIAHNKRSISYVYPDQRVTLRFSHLSPEHVTVRFQSGRGITRRAESVAQRVKEASRRRLQQSMLNQSLRDGAQSGKELLSGVRGAIDNFAGGIIDRAIQTAEGLPGLSTLRSYAQNQAQSANEAFTREAQRVKDSAQLDFLPTNR